MLADRAKRVPLAIRVVLIGLALGLPVYRGFSFSGYWVLDHRESPKSAREMGLAFLTMSLVIGTLAGGLWFFRRRRRNRQGAR